MKCWQILGLVVASHQAYVANAQACGPTPPMLTALLPVAGAQGVPLDAALITSSNLWSATSTLRKVDAIQADASLADAGVDGGVPRIALSRVCYAAQDGGSLCVAKPVVELEPETTYEWSATLDPRAGFDPEYVGPTELRRFTTSRAAYAAPELALDVQVLTHNANPTATCGPVVSATLGIDAGDLASPIVVNVAGFTPSYVMEAKVLTPETPSLEFLLLGPPDCITLEAFDVAGARTELNSLCLEQELPVTTLDEQDQPVETEPPPQEGVALDAVEEPESNGCAVGPLRSRRSASALVAIAALFLVVRRKKALRYLASLAESVPPGRRR